jgi:aspartate dehydrogenase
MASVSQTKRRRVGIVGFGLLGQYLVDRIVHDPAASSVFEIAFVWNRNYSRVSESANVPAAARCDDLADIARFSPDIIVEVCHPRVTQEWGTRFLAIADFYAGSPTAFADAAADVTLREAAAAGPHGLYIPAGALWGSQDLQRLSARGGIGSLTITMKKHPASLKLEGQLGAAVTALVAAGTPGESIVYEGPVRALAVAAPNNVNTMAAAAIAVPTLGFDGVIARLVSIKGSCDIVKAWGAAREGQLCAAVLCSHAGERPRPGRPRDYD